MVLAVVIHPPVGGGATVPRVEVWAQSGEVFLGHIIGLVARHCLESCGCVELEHRRLCQGGRGCLDREEAGFGSAWGADAELLRADSALRLCSERRGHPFEGVASQDTGEEQGSHLSFSFWKGGNCAALEGAEDLAWYISWGESFEELV